MYKPGMGELPILLFQMDQLILEHAPELHNHFKAHEFSTATFASKWFLTLFCSVFPKVNPSLIQSLIRNPFFYSILMTLEHTIIYRLDRRLKMTLQNEYSVRA